MCWSVGVSLATGIWSWTIAIYVYMRNASERDRWGAVFLLSFSTMQWAEAVLWMTMDGSHGDECSALNSWIGRHVMGPVLALELVSSLYGSPTYRSEMVKLPRIALLHGLFATSIALAPLFLIDCCTTITPHGHLLWWNRRISLLPFTIFSIAIAAPSVAWMRPRSAMVVHSMMFVWATWLIGLLSDSNGSMWCLTANLYGMLLLVDPYMFK